MSKLITLESKCRVHISIKKVWNIITDDSAFHGLGFPGTYSGFDKEKAKKGTTFYNQSIFGDGKFLREVKEWQPLHLFSFGHPDNDWTYKWQLNELRDNEVEVIFLRRFKKKSGLLTIFKPPKYTVEQSLTNETIEKLEQACKLLSENRKDGIYRVN